MTKSIVLNPLSRGGRQFFRKKQLHLLCQLQHPGRAGVAYEQGIERVADWLQALTKRMQERYQTNKTKKKKPACPKNGAKQQVQTGTTHEQQHTASLKSVKGNLENTSSALNA